MSKEFISVNIKGDGNKTQKDLEQLIKNNSILNLLNECGQKGVEALASSTPVRTGATASSWS